MTKSIRHLGIIMDGNRRWGHKTKTCRAFGRSPEGMRVLRRAQKRPGEAKHFQFFA